MGAGHHRGFDGRNNGSQGGGRTALPGRGPFRGRDGRGNRGAGGRTWQQARPSNRSDDTVKRVDHTEKEKIDEMIKVQQGGSGGGDTEMGEAGEGEKMEGGEVMAGVRCLRCTKKGHVAARCNSEIYCVICNSHDHVNHRCLVLKQPRPVAHAVGYAVHGLGFYHIPRPPLSRTKKESKTAVISVEGGEISKEEVQRQLERLFPDKWVWELKDHEENTFLAKIPIQN